MILLLVLVHMVKRYEKEGEKKNVLFSRFYLGKVKKSNKDYPFSAPLVNYVGNTFLYRNLQLTQDVVHGLFRHCAEEMAILGKMLPQLYLQEVNSTNKNSNEGGLLIA